MSALGYLILLLSQVATYFGTKYLGGAAGACAGTVVAAVGGRVLHLQPSPASSNVGDP